MKVPAHLALSRIDQVRQKEKHDQVCDISSVRFLQRLKRIREPTVAHFLSYRLFLDRSASSYSFSPTPCPETNIALSHRRRSIHEASCIGPCSQTNFNINIRGYLVTRNPRHLPPLCVKEQKKQAEDNKCARKVTDQKKIHERKPHPPSRVINRDEDLPEIHKNPHGTFAHLPSPTVPVK